MISIQPELVMIKLGGSLLTDKAKPFTVRPGVIKRIANEIHNARQVKELRLIVGHGGGSFPHIPANKYQTNKGIINKKSYRGLAEVQDAASRLNRLVVRELLDAGENAISIQLSSSGISENSRIQYMYTEPIIMLLSYGMIPVPYGDVSLDKKKGCSIVSTEEIFYYLAKELKRQGFNLTKIINCGIVDGVFRGDPIKNPDSEIIPEITNENIDEIRKYLSGSHGTDVTGGMLSKVEKMLKIAAETGVETFIINGLIPGRIEKALKGENVLGTRIIGHSHTTGRG